MYLFLFAVHDLIDLKKDFWKKDFILKNQNRAYLWVYPLCTHSYIVVMFVFVRTIVILTSVIGREIELKLNVFCLQ